MADGLPGRPRLYQSPEDFDAKVNEYYQHCMAKDEPITWTGLALFLGFSSRQSIDEYANYDGFSDSVKRAKLLVEWAYEKRACGNNATGPIFILKNLGWSDKQQVDHSSSDGSMTPAKQIDYSKLSKEALREIMAASDDSHKD